MTTVALWPRQGRNNTFTSAALLGKPVWRRTYEAALASNPRKILWIGNAAPDGLTAIAASRIASIRDTVVMMPAELPCLRASALRRLVKQSGQRPGGLYPSDGGSAVVLAGQARSLGSLRARTLDELARGLKPAPVFGDDDDDLLVVDSAAAWGTAHGILRERKLDELVRRGVLVPDPQTVSVDPEVSVGAGTRIAPFVLLEGDTRIGKNCTIGSFSHLVNAAVGTGTIILDHCFIRDSRIGKEASIGPFAHLRPESDVGDQARVGNFVELKKSKLGAGAKAPHLTYVGDAEIGRDANLGAGTITCNYDGRVKSRTIVGDGAFIGSDVQLVAPVKVGKGAFVAAGSCIVSDVPAYALALARSRQIIKENWAKQRARARRGSRKKKD